MRDCLAERRQGSDADHWRTTGDVPSRLGGALLAVAVTDPALSSEARLAKLAEAEALLLEGNAVLQESETIDRKYKRDSLIRLVHLYQAWDKPEKAAEWQQAPDEFNQAEAKREAEEHDESITP